MAAPAAAAADEDAPGSSGRGGSAWRAPAGHVLPHLSRQASGDGSDGGEEEGNIVLAVEHVGGALIAVEELAASIIKPPSTFWACTFNLSKVIMGAGMMAIPKAFYLLGWASGSLLLLTIHLLTYLSLGGLVEASEATGIRSYSGLVRSLLGRSQEVILQLAVFLNCYLMNVVFIVVLGDILIGSPGSPGLIVELLPAAAVPPLLLQRPVTLGALSALVLLPLASMRSMERLAVVNVIGVLCNFLFGGVTLALAVAAARAGQLQPLDPWPRWDQLGSSPLLVALGLAAVAPVMLNCDTCHQSLHPLMPLLKPYSSRGMKGVVMTALTVCNCVYVVVAITSCLTFGSVLRSDVLANIGVESMSPLLGFYPAHVVACVVRLGYLCSIVGSYVLLCFPLRQCLGEVVLHGQQDVERLWLPLTVGLVGTVYAIACFVPSIWGILGFVGATASTVQAWVMPGLIMWVICRDKMRAGKGGLLLGSGSPTAAAAAAARRRGSAVRVSPRLPSMAEPLLQSQEDMRQWWLNGDGEAEACWVLLLKASAGLLVTFLGMLLFVNGFVHQFLSFGGSSSSSGGGGGEGGLEGRASAGLPGPAAVQWQPHLLVQVYGKLLPARGPLS